MQNNKSQLKKDFFNIKYSNEDKSSVCDNCHFFEICRDRKIECDKFRLFADTGKIKSNTKKKNNFSYCYDGRCGHCRMKLNNVNDNPYCSIKCNVEFIKNNLPDFTIFNCKIFFSSASYIPYDDRRFYKGYEHKKIKDFFEACQEKYVDYVTSFVDFKRSSNIPKLRGNRIKRG